MMETAEVVRILAIAGLLLLGGVLTSCSYLRALQGWAGQPLSSRAALAEPESAPDQDEGQDMPGASDSVTNPQ